MAKGFEIRNVGVASELRGLAKLDQQLDHVVMEAAEGFDDEREENAAFLLHLSVVLGDLAVGAVKRCVAGDRYGLCRAIGRGSRVCNRPVSGKYLCQMAEHVVGKALGSFVAV